MTAFVPFFKKSNSRFGALETYRCDGIYLFTYVFMCVCVCVCEYVHVYSTCLCVYTQCFLGSVLSIIFAINFRTILLEKC